MSCISSLSFTLIRNKIPFCYRSFKPSLFHSHSHGGFTLQTTPSLTGLLLSHLDSPKNPVEFPQRNPVHEPTVPREVPEISTVPEIDPTTPPEVNTTDLPPLSPGQNPGPDFPIPPSPSPPGPDFPLPPLPSPPDTDVPPMPGPQPDVVPPRPAGPDIVTSPSPPDIVPPMGLL